MQRHRRLLSFSLLVSIFFISILNGCLTDFTVRTVLENDEVVKVGDPVYVDGIPAGSVKWVKFHDGSKLAELRISERGLIESKMRVGLVRLIEKDKINLTSDAVQHGAVQLSSGDIIPSKAHPIYTLQKYGTTESLIVAAIATVALTLLFIVFRSFFNLLVILICLLLSASTAWVLYPLGVHYVEKLYDHFPETAQMKRVESSDISLQGNSYQQHNSNAITTTDKSVIQPQLSTPNNTKHIRDLQVKVQEFLSGRPDPRLVSFVAVFLVSFVFYSLLLGKALKAIRR